MDCIFCKILRGEIPCYKVYEDENVLAFLDINPVSRGHTLVIPKKHYSRIEEMPPEEFSEFAKSLQKVINIIKKISEDYNIVINQGEKAGQVIFHLHVHIIPREGEEKVFLWESKKLTEEEANEILELLKR